MSLAEHHTSSKGYLQDLLSKPVTPENRKISISDKTFLFLKEVGETSTGAKYEWPPSPKGVSSLRERDNILGVFGAKDWDICLPMSL